MGNSRQMDCPPASSAFLLPGMVLLKGLSVTEGRHSVAELKNLLLRATFEASFPKRNLLTRDSHLCLRRSAQELFLTTTSPKLMTCWRIKQFSCPDLFLHPCRNILPLFLAWCMQRPLFLPGHCPCCHPSVASTAFVPIQSVTTLSKALWVAWHRRSMTTGALKGAGQKIIWSLSWTVFSVAW